MDANQNAEHSFADSDFARTPLPYNVTRQNRSMSYPFNHFPKTHIALTPVKEMEEDNTIKSSVPSKLNGEPSKYNRAGYLSNPSEMSTQVSNEEGISKHTCSNPKCRQCGNSGISANTVKKQHSADDLQQKADHSVTKPRKDAKSDVSSPYNAKNKLSTVSNQKSKPKPMGSGGSTQKSKKPKKKSQTTDQEQARLQKGAQYEAKTAQVMERMEAKYKSVQPKNRTDANSQITPVIEDVYPAKKDNAKELLGKVKVTTPKVPYYLRSVSAPARKRKEKEKMPEMPKTSRVKKSVLSLNEAVGTQNMQDPDMKQKVSEKSEDIGEDRKQNDLANVSNSESQNSNAVMLNSATSVDDVALRFNNGTSAKRRTLHKVNTAPSRLYLQVKQAAINEGVEKIVFVDFPEENAGINHSDSMADHGLQSLLDNNDQLDSDTEFEPIENDPGLPNPERASNIDIGNAKDTNFPDIAELKIQIPSTSDSDADQSRSPAPDELRDMLSRKWPVSQHQESSSTSGSSLGISFREMYGMAEYIPGEDFGSVVSPTELDEIELNDSVEEDILEDSACSSDDGTSSFVFITNENGSSEFKEVTSSSLVIDATTDTPEDSRNTEDSSGESVPSLTMLPSHVDRFKLNEASLASRPSSSKAWYRNDREDCDDVEHSENTLVDDGDGSIPFQRYETQEPSLKSEEKRPTIKRTLTQEALKQHDLLVSKCVDSTSERELIYDEEQRANMQSRLSMQTTTTDYSVMTDTTVTGDMETTEFNGWRKGRELGHGTYGTVFEALTREGKLVAVKMVELTTSNREVADKEFRRVRSEVDLLKILRHKNIVRLLGTCFDGSCVHIFMEHVPGGSIKSILTQYGALEERIFRKYTRQILEGLTYLHSCGIVHRDIKGSNVMLMTNGTIKLIDFGCAKRLRDSAMLSESTGSKDAKLLKTMLGTPYWMAPEVITSQGHGPKSDIWSVGATVYEMAMAHPPLKNLESTAALFHIGNGNEMPQLSKPEFSRSVISFVKKCFTRDQYQRPKAFELLNHRFLKKMPK